MQSVECSKLKISLILRRERFLSKKKGKSTFLFSLGFKSNRIYIDTWLRNKIFLYAFLAFIPFSWRIYLHGNEWKAKGENPKLNSVTWIWMLYLKRLVWFIKIPKEKSAKRNIHWCKTRLKRSHSLLKCVPFFLLLPFHFGSIDKSKTEFNESKGQESTRLPYVAI